MVMFRFVEGRLDGLPLWGSTICSSCCRLLCARSEGDGEDGVGVGVGVVMCSGVRAAGDEADAGRGEWTGTEEGSIPMGDRWGCCCCKCAWLWCMGGLGDRAAVADELELELELAASGDI